MGRKYKFKPDSNPPPGYYDTDKATSIVKSKAFGATIQPKSSYVKRLEMHPGAGDYDPDVKFASSP